MVCGASTRVSLLGVLKYAVIIKTSFINCDLVDYIFIIRANVDLNLNLNEVKSVRYVSKAEMEHIFANPGKS
jgi:isopentenyldiphosphate isomerase